MLDKSSFFLLLKIVLTILSISIYKAYNSNGLCILILIKNTIFHSCGFDMLLVYIVHNLFYILSNSNTCNTWSIKNHKR